MLEDDDSTWAFQEYFPAQNFTYNIANKTEEQRNAIIVNLTVQLHQNLSWLDRDVSCNIESDDLVSSSWFQWSVYCMYAAVFFAALAGNGLVCSVVHRSPRMKTVTNYFIVNLAVGDILMALFCVPFSFVSQLVLRHWPFGALMCKVVNYSQAVSVLVSAYTLLAISLDRYHAIMRPLKPRLSRTEAKLVVVAVWIGALATAAPIPVVSKISRPTEWHRICETDICLEDWESPEQSAQYTCALLVLQFALPLSALVVTYARIACSVWGGRVPGEAHSARDSRIHNNKRKMIKMMVTVVSVFTICWLPLNIFIILWTVHEQDESWATWPGMPYVWFACHWLAMSHACYNPFIYCYMNTRYRRGFKEALRSLLCLRMMKPGSQCQRSSLCDGIPMSEMLGANGITRQGTISTCSRQRRTSCTCCPARQNGHNTIRYNTGTSIPPVRALSIRTHFQ